MNKRQKEVIQSQLNAEKKVLKQVEKQYTAALNDINTKLRILQSDELTQSRIYRIEHQKALKSQVSGILDKLHSDEYSTIEQFLKDSYTSGFIGTTYDLFGQGVPLIMPIDPKDAVRAVMTDSKISGGLYNSLGVDVKKLKKSISAEISRGLASDMSYEDITRNIANATKAPLGRARTIVLTETHRIKQASTRDVQVKAKEKGADVLKQWNSTLDGETRKTHRRLDGQIREVEEPFEMDGKEAMYPGDFNDPAEDCNCRCESLTRARWALGEDELETLKKRAEFFGLDKAKDFEDFKGKYLKAVEETKTVFDSATTIKELNAMTKQAFSEQGIDADFGGMDLEVAKRQADILLKLSKEYDTQLVSISTTGASKYLGNVERKGKTYSDLTKARMQISKKYGKNETTWNAEIEKAVSTGNAPNIPAINYAAYTVVHEFAHSLNNDYITTFYGFGNEDFWREVAKVKDEYKEAYSRDKSISLGKYATTNNDEFVAECFAEALLSENPSEYAVRTKKLIDKYFKRKK